MFCSALELKFSDLFTELISATKSFAAAIEPVPPELLLDEELELLLLLDEELEPVDEDELLELEDEELELLEEETPLLKLHR